jgi:hypothetical protein
MLKKYVFLFVVSISFIAKAQYPKSVSDVLDKAGKNRTELEKVIQHYQMKEDSLKLKAAYFLISNLEGLTHLNAENLHPYSKIFTVYDSLLRVGAIVPVPKQEILYPEIYDAWEQLTNIYDDPSIIEYPDIQYITSNFLIHNIDFAFKAWRMYPWAKHLTFEQFCENLLPYKMSNEPLVNWREELMNKYQWLPDSLTNPSDVINVSRVLYNNLKWFLLHRNLWMHPLVGQENMHTAKCGTCFNKTDLNMFVMRAMGLAITRDFTFYWGNKDNNHYWNAFVMNDGTFLDFEGLGTLDQRWQGRMEKHKIVNPGDFYQSTSRYSKVFRETFSIQQSALFEDNKIGVFEEIPIVFHKNRYLDVTDEYTSTKDVSIQLSSIQKPPKYAYLCTYNKQQWMPAFWGRVTEDSKVVFKKMGKGILYLPCRFEKNQFTPLENPFVLDSLGNQIIIKPSSDFHKSITFTHDLSGTRRVRKGENYQLYFWEENKWKMIGEQIAEEKAKLIFENVPVNALLRIRDINGKNNERIFYYKDGKQYFF